MLSTRDRVLAGVSGGADSVCLVMVLKELGFDLAIAHLNHALRGRESDEDQEFTRKFAEKLGVQFFAKTVSLTRPSPSFEASPSRARASRPLPKGEGNIEAAGRAARK